MVVKIYVIKIMKNTWFPNISHIDNNWVSNQHIRIYFWLVMWD